MVDSINSPYIHAAIANEITDLGALLSQFVNQDYEKGFKQLQYIMDKDKHFHDDFARRTMLTLIVWLAVEHPLVKHYKLALRRYTHQEKGMEKIP